MKYLKIFESFDKEELFTELTPNQYEDFIQRHNYIRPTERVSNLIKKYIESDEYLSGLELVVTCNLSTLSTVIESDNGPLLPYSIIFDIIAYEDEWFCVTIEIIEDDGETSHIWYYKCDTIDGIYKLLQKWEDFEKPDDSHWDDDQPIDDGVLFESIGDSMYKRIVVCDFIEFDGEYPIIKKWKSFSEEKVIKRDLEEYFENTSTEMIYKEIDDNEYLSFIQTHELVQPLESNALKINKFIKSEKSLKKFRLRCSLVTSMEEGDDEDSLMLVESIHSDIFNMSLNIYEYDDEWFIVICNRKDDEYNNAEVIYKCDTIGGVTQLILKWKSLLVE
jgi:hypothetical protein